MDADFMVDNNDEVSPKPESEASPEPPNLGTRDKSQPRSRGNTQSRLAARTLDDMYTYVGFDDDSGSAVASKP